jgi:hypothetical protein
MALLPNKGKRIFQELNVDAPGGLKVSSCYDLALYPELGSASRGVLVVTVIGSVKFIDGKASTGGGALSWTGTEKSDFLSGVSAAVADVWSEKHRLTTTSTVPAITDVGVLFDLQLSEGLGITSHSHWNIEIKKVDKWTSSCVDPLFSTWISNGKTQLDSLDLRPEQKGGPSTQRGAVHEFGHMLGYRDEYPAAKANGSWTADSVSVMHSCEDAKPRHYAFFADWLTDQFKVAAALSKQAIEWKVDGATTLLTAMC